MAAALPPGLSERDLAGPALRGFFGIADAWELSEKEQIAILGLTSRSTLKSWKSGRVTRISHDTLERISCVFGIFKAINILLPNAERADEWIRRDNTAPLFGGGSALERMTSGNIADLYLVRRYLDAERG